MSTWQGWPDQPRGPELRIGDAERERAASQLAEHPDELAAVWAPFEGLPVEEGPDLSVLKNEVERYLDENVY